MVAASSTSTPSGYRVSLLSGSLEVSARLKNADDLELLMRVLEANKALFARADKLEPEIFGQDRPTSDQVVHESIRDASVGKGGPTQGEDEGERISA